MPKPGTLLNQDPFDKIGSRKATMCAVMLADFRAPKHLWGSRRLGDGEQHATGDGQEWGGQLKNSTRLGFRQNKTHLTQPNTKGIFRSSSLLTQHSWSLVCTEFMVWPGKWCLSEKYVLHRALPWELEGPFQLLSLLQFYNLPSARSVTTSLILFLVSFLGPW